LLDVKRECAYLLSYESLIYVRSRPASPELGTSRILDYGSCDDKLNILVMLFLSGSKISLHDVKV